MDRKSWLLHVPVLTQLNLQGDAWFVVFFVLLAVNTFGGYAVILYTECHVLHMLHRLSSMMEEKTRRIHAEFRKALILLAICPLLFSVVPMLSVGVMAVLSLNGGFLAPFMTTMSTSIALVNPLVTVLVVRPYRSVVLRCFRGKVSTGFSTA